MTIQELIDINAFQDKPYKMINIVDGNVRIDSVVMYEPIPEFHTEPNILYIVDDVDIVSKLPASCRNYVILTESLNTQVHISAELKENSNIMISDSSAESLTVFMQHVLMEDSRVDRILRTITEAMFSTGSSKMLAITAEQLKSYVMIIDHSGAILERQENLKIKSLTTSFERLWEQENLREYYENSKSTYLFRSKITSEMRIRDVDVYWDDVICMNVISRPIRVNRIEIGKIFAFSPDNKYDVADGEILYRVSQIYADKLMRECKYEINKKQKFINFMQMMLDSKYPNLQAINRAMDELDIVFKGSCCVAVIDIVFDGKKETSRQNALNVLGARIAVKMQDVLWVIYQDVIVILFSFSEGESIPRHNLEELKQLTEVNELAVGISHNFSSPVGVRPLYQQARQAAELGFDFLKKRITFYDEIVHFAMFNQLQREVDIISLIDSNIMKLYKSDKESHKEYMNTLYYYLRCNGNTNEVANLTHMHRNTVLYRMEKIQDLIDVKLEDGVTVMRLMLSFEMLKYLKLIDLT